MPTTTSCQFDSNKSDSAISTSFSHDEFTNCSSSEESSSNSSNEFEDSNVSSSIRAEVDCPPTSSSSPVDKTKLLKSSFDKEKIEETSPSTHSVAGESEVSSTTSGSVRSARTSSPLFTDDNGNTNVNSDKSSQSLYSCPDYAAGGDCIFHASFLNAQTHHQHLNHHHHHHQHQQQQGFYFYTPYQNLTNANNGQLQHHQSCYCYAYNHSHQSSHQQPFYYSYPNQSQPQHHHHQSQPQQQSFYCYQPYHHNHQQPFYHYAYQQHQPVVFLSPPPPPPPPASHLPTHHLHPHVPQTLGQFATIVPYATSTPAPTLPVAPSATSSQPHQATVNGIQTHVLAPTAHPQLHLSFNPIAHAAPFAIPTQSSAAVHASGPVSGSPVIAFSRLKLGYNLISHLPIDAQSARVRQAYGMDKVWHDEFEQLFSQFISSIVWALIEVETMPKIRGSFGNIGSTNTTNNTSESGIKSSGCNSSGSSSSSDSGVAQVDDSSSGVSINEGSEESNNGRSSCCSAENDSSDLIEHRGVDNNQEQIDESVGSTSSLSCSPRLVKTVTTSVSQNRGDLHDFNSNQSRCPTRFRVFIDSAKVRFCCDNCGHGWTSMKGRVVFWYELFEFNQTTLFAAESFNNISNETASAARIFNNSDNHLIGYVAYKLFGQQCDICKIENRFERPMWYPEEVTKVLNNLYNKIGQIYFGFEMPGIDKQRRAGKPKTSHNSSLCQACHDGVCTDRK